MVSFELSIFEILLFIMVAINYYNIKKHLEEHQNESVKVI